MVLIRPRGGDFLYTPDEVEVMLDDIRCAKESGAHGVVVGALRPDGAIDEAVTAELIREARPMAVTFHRAFDMTPDVGAAFQACVRLGVDRILTSGLANTAAEGVAVIRELVRMAELSNAGGIVGDGARPITILAGAGLSEENIAWLVTETGVHEVHGSARVPVESGMVYRWEDGREKREERTGERERTGENENERERERTRTRERERERTRTRERERTGENENENENENEREREREIDRERERER
jgi:copper homeostasis protein